MEITVLGCGAAYPRPGGACAGFLYTADDTNVWVDAGNGTFARLQSYVPFRDVDALVLTHGHADHIADVLPFMYALGFDPGGEVTTVPVYAPGDVAPSLKWPLGGTSKERFKKVFDFQAIHARFRVGALEFSPFRTQHPAETYGLRVRHGEKTAVYTSDTALFPDLAAECKDADILIIEATYLDGTDAPKGIHLFAREAGRVAREANAKRVVLTHIWATFEPDEAVAEAAKEFDGQIEAAVEGARYTV